MNTPSRVPTVSTTAEVDGEGLAKNIPTSSSEQSRIMDSLRLSFTSRRNSKQGSDFVGGGSDSSLLADVAWDSGTGSGAGRKSAAAAGEEDTTRGSEANHTTAGRGREDDVALVNSIAAAGDDGGRGGSNSPGGIGDGRTLRMWSSSRSPGTPTEETGLAPTEEGKRWEDEEQAKSCVFQ